MFNLRAPKKTNQVLSAGIALMILVLSGCASTNVRETPVAHTDEEKARLYVQAANGALVEGDPTAALNYLVKAEELDEDLPEIYYSRSLAYHAKGDRAEAIQSVRKALKLRKNFSDANNTLGKLLIDDGKYAEAEKVLKRSAQDALYREAYKSQTNLGILYYRQARFDEAAKWFNKAIRVSPGLACVAYYYRGHLDLRDRKVKNAIADYDRATQKFCGDFAEAHFALGVAYAQAQEFAKARKKFIQVRELYPNTEVAERAMERLRYLP